MLIDTYNIILPFRETHLQQSMMMVFWFSHGARMLAGKHRDTLLTGSRTASEPHYRVYDCVPVL